MNKRMKRSETTIAEIKDDAKFFAIDLFGIAMLVLGNQLSILNGWVFWFPVGMFTTLCLRTGIDLLESLRKE